MFGYIVWINFVIILPQARFLLHAKSILMVVRSFFFVFGIGSDFNNVFDTCFFFKVAQNKTSFFFCWTHITISFLVFIVVFCCCMERKKMYVFSNISQINCVYTIFLCSYGHVIGVYH